MSNLSGKRVLIFQQRGWGMRIGHLLAKKLQKEGCHLAALTFKKTAHQFHANQKEVKYDIIVSTDEVMEDPAKYLDEDDISLKKICEDLKVDSIWTYVSSLRQLAKSYDRKYYYAYTQQVSDEELIQHIAATYKYMKKVFDEFKPDVIITPNFSHLVHIMFNIYAERHGIPMLGIMDSKIKNMYIFVHSYLLNKGPFYDRVDALNEKKEESKNRKKAQQYIKEFRKNFKQPYYMQKYYRKFSIVHYLKKELKPLYEMYLYYKSGRKNRIASIGIATDYRPPRIILRDHFTRKRNIRFANNYSYYPFDKVDKCVYLPLQVQPEVTIDVLAPYFSNQLEVARLVAQSLPDDYTLVVKDHRAFLGKRSPSYLKKLALTPNVKLLDYRTPTDEILKKCDLIVSPSSTSIAEAAFYNKPGIQFGNLGTTLKLPNIQRHTDMTTLSKKVKEVLQLDLHTPEYDRLLENYVAAVYDAGFEFKWHEVWSGEEQDDIDSLLNIYLGEIASVLGINRR